MSYQRLLFPLLAALVLSGAARAQDPAATQPQEPKPTKITVLTPGDAPRRELRLAPVVGLVQTTETVTDTFVSTTMGDMEMPTPEIPNIKMVYETTITDVAESGDISLSLIVKDAGFVGEVEGDPMMFDMMRGAIVEQIGMKGEAVINNRGITLKEKFDELSDEAGSMGLGSLSEIVNQLTPVFPAEAIGLGAKWRVERDVEHNGMKFKNIVIYELVSADGDELKIKAVHAPTAKPQTFTVSQMGMDMDINLTSFEAEGRGTLTVGLNRVFAREAKFDMTMRMSMEIDMGGMIQVMEQEVETSSKVKSSAKEGEKP